MNLIRTKYKVFAQKHLQLILNSRQNAMNMIKFRHFKFLSKKQILWSKKFRFVYLGSKGYQYKKYEKNGTDYLWFLQTFTLKTFTSTQTEAKEENWKT